ncbi:MAG: SUMF1/EgtB/PvdO family nonheme iron enzyme, partial [Bacteroidales bacterium]|nr:SUMF1/EgtB/PvdO family nonheme iron enzyme [Bacteroidales bacterium]
MLLFGCKKYIDYSAIKVETFYVNGVSFEMVYVEGGTFDMGATTEQGSDADSDEYPVHSVTLSDYYIGKCEVTQELWEAVMGSNPGHFKGAQNP